MWHIWMSHVTCVLDVLLTCGNEPCAICQGVASSHISMSHVTLVRVEPCLFYLCDNVCDMPGSYLWRDPFICVTWPTSSLSGATVGVIERDISQLHSCLPSHIYNSWVMCEDVSWPDINVSGQHSFLAWHIYVSCNKKANHCHDTSISLTHGERAPRGRVAWLSCHTYGISPSHPCQISLLHPYKIPFDTYTNCMDTWHEWMQMLRYMHRSRVHGYADMDADKWRIRCIHTYAYQYMWHMTRYICHAAMAHVTHDMIETWHSSLVTWHQYDCIMSHDTHSFNSHHLSLSRHLVTHSKMIMAR